MIIDGSRSANITIRCAFLFGFAATFYSCSNDDSMRERKIVELSFLTTRDSSKFKDSPLVSVSHYYIAEKSLLDDKDTTIPNFVRRADKKEANQINYIFYKVSHITNEEHLRKVPRDIVRYSQDHDMVWGYNYDKIHNRIFRTKYKGEERLFGDTISVNIPNK